jgi:hypothetical protein
MLQCIYDPNQCINLFILWNNALVLIVKNDFFKKVGSIKWKEKYDRGRRIPSTYKYINQDYSLASVPSHDLVHSIKYNLLNKNNNNNNNKIIMVKLKTRVEIMITIIFQNIFLFENILK